MTTAAAKKGGLFYGWVIVGAGLMVWTLEPGMYTSFGVFFKPISADMGWSRTTVSGAFTMASLMLAVFSPISGALADRYGPRRLVMASGVLVGTGYALLSTTQALWQFYAFFLLVGMSMGIAFAPITSTVVRWFAENRGRALGITSVGTGLGGMVFPPLSNYLIEIWGWRSTYLFFGILLGVLVVLSGSLLRRSPQEMGLLPYGVKETEHAASVPAAQAGAEGYSLRQALATGAFWRVFFSAMAFVFSFAMVQAHLVPHATDRGLAPATAALVMAVIGASNSVGRLGLGALSDRVGRKRMMFVLLLTVSGAMLSLIWASQAWAFFLFAAIYGLAYGGAVVSWMGIQGDLFGLASAGAILGATQTGTNTGGASGPLLAGYVFDATQSYSLVFIVASLAPFIMSWLVLSLRRPRRG
ncbi:MAG: MFS transporter [Dehalococcoidia bacterium]